MKGHGAFTSTRVTPLPVLSEDHVKAIASEEFVINLADDEWILCIDAGVDGGKGPINYLKIIPRGCGKALAPMDIQLPLNLLLLMELLQNFMDTEVKG